MGLKYAFAVAIEELRQQHCGSAVTKRDHEDVLIEPDLTWFECEVAPRIVKTVQLTCSRTYVNLIAMPGRL
jgi:hypothetical protein